MADNRRELRTAVKQALWRNIKKRSPKRAIVHEKKKRERERGKERERLQVIQTFLATKGCHLEIW